MLPEHKEYLKLFPNKKKLARANLLREAAEMAADSVSSKIQQTHGDIKAIKPAISDARSTAFVDQYISEVILFKKMNNIAPDKRIEAPKIAAIMISHLHAKPITDLFILSPSYPPEKSPYPKVARGAFFNRIVYACLGLPKDFVNEGLGQDLLQVLVTEPLDNRRLLSVTFKGVFLARGDEKSCLED